MQHALTRFILDPRLASDTLPVLELGLSSLRLLNDSRWPWLVLVPKRAGASELQDLASEDQGTLWQEMLLAGLVLKAATGCDKVNTAAIGNIVRQLHVHVIARRDGDANWPGPVWGFPGKTAYRPEAADALIGNICSQWGKVK